MLAVRERIAAITALLREEAVEEDAANDKESKDYEDEEEDWGFGFHGDGWLKVGCSCGFMKVAELE